MAQRPLPTFPPTGSSSTSAGRSSTSLVSGAVTGLLDKQDGQVDRLVWDYFGSEMISILIESTLFVSSTRARLEAMVNNDFQLLSPTYVPPDPSSTRFEENNLTSEQEKELRFRLDSIGQRVGWGMAERLTRERPPFTLVTQPTPGMPNASSSLGPSAHKETPKPEPLELIKFICKDLWIALYGKQIDNLRTNHRGVWVLQDNRFAGGGLGKASGADYGLGIGIKGDNGEYETAAEEVTRRARLFLPFPTGVIRGALANLGLQCSVMADISTLPQCTFQITIPRPETAGPSTASNS